jgi:hypothetical protein
MQLTAHIIATRGKRMDTITVTTKSPGLDRATIHAAEQAAKGWARDNQHKVISDIVSQGEYRAWVEPIPPGRLRNAAQLGRSI